jgi:hypothetical protein
MPRTSRCKRSIFRGQGAREYMNYGFTTLRDLGSVDPEWPTIDLRNALNTGLVEGPRLFVVAHIISASAGHGDLRDFYASRWTLRVSAIADDLGSIRALVRREHTLGSDWIKTTNTVAISAPATIRRGDVGSTTRWRSADIDRPSAWHAGRRSHGRRRRMQAGIRCGARSLEHAYLIGSSRPSGCWPEAE